MAIALTVRGSRADRSRGGRQVGKGDCESKNVPQVSVHRVDLHASLTFCSVVYLSLFCYRNNDDAIGQKKTARIFRVSIRIAETDEANNSRTENERTDN